MRILHTSDWHLGQRLLQNDRFEEQALALHFLLETIQIHNVDVLLVSGDVFDIGNPPYPARKMYYKFLYDLLGTSCRYVVITGGNHDAPGTLDAPRDLLQQLNVFVFGASTSDPSGNLVELRNGAGHLEAVVAAVPYLRERDLRPTIPGETGSERVEGIRNALRNYFAEQGKKAAEYQIFDVPVLCMAHLYAVGAASSEEQRNIYIGDTENIEAASFPEIFSYVALGHIHRPQAVGGLAHVRYSGSLIPLSFSETKDQKGVYLLEYDGAALKNCQFIPVPVEISRRLKTVEGTLDEVKQKLQDFAERQTSKLMPWVEAIIHTDTVLPGLDEELRAFCADMYLDLLKIRVMAGYHGIQRQGIQEELRSLEPIEVFRRRLEVAGHPPDSIEAFEATFLELMDWMNDTSEAI